MKNADLRENMTRNFYDAGAHARRFVRREGTGIELNVYDSMSINTLIDVWRHLFWIRQFRRMD